MTVAATDQSNILPLQLDNVSFEGGGKRLIKDFSYTFNAGPRTVPLSF